MKTKTKLKSKQNPKTRPMFNKKQITAHQLLLGGKPLEGNEYGSLHSKTIFLLFLIKMSSWKDI